MGRMPGGMRNIEAPHWYYQYQQGRAQPELLHKTTYIVAHVPAEREEGN